MPPFHYAFKVTDLASTRRFYMDILGCTEGRSTDTWVDFSLFGHQLSAHISDRIPEPDYCGKVDGTLVPMPHFGCVLSMEDFKEIQARLEAHDVPFIIPPTLRYPGQVGEQWMMFLQDFSTNSMEFKAFERPEEMFSV